MAAPAFTGQQGYGSYGGTTTTAVSSSLTTVTGRGVLVIAAWQDTATAPTLTDSKSNSAPTLIGTVISGPAFGVTAYLGVYLHTAIGTGGTSHTFTATGPANSYPAIAALSLDQAVALDTTTGVNDTSSPWVAATLTTGAVDCLVLACGGIPDSGAGNTVSATGYTQQMSQGNGPDWGISVLRKTVAASGSSETPSITSSPGGANSDSGQVRMVSLKAAGGSDVTVGATGVEGTGAPGSAGPATDTALTNNAATGGVGTVLSTRSKALTNNVGTGSVGTTSPSLTIALTGAEATGAVGDVAVSGSSDVSVALTGVEGAGAVGDAQASSDLELTGASASADVGAVAAALSSAVSGVGATGGLGDTFPSVSAALSGAEAAGEVGTVGIVGDVTVALTGVTATGEVGSVSVPGVPEVAEQLSYPGGKAKARKAKTYNYDYSSPKALEPVAKAKPGKVKPRKSIPDDVAEMLRLLESSQAVTAEMLAEQKSIFATEVRADEEDELIAVIAMAL